VVGSVPNLSLLKMRDNKETEQILRRLKGTPIFEATGKGDYRVLVETDIAKTATNKQNRFDRLTGEGVTPTYEVYGQQIPIKHMTTRGNEISMIVDLDEEMLEPETHHRSVGKLGLRFRKRR
jgi:hypothetical protein